MSQTTPSPVWEDNKEAGKHVAFEVPEEQKHQRKTPSELLLDDIEVAGKNVNLKARASIYRVPHEFREQNKNLYTPYIVSIGPLHSKDTRLDPGIKKHRLRLFLQGIGVGTNKENIDVIEEYLEEMRKLREEAKYSYGEEVDGLLTPEMMFIDGCFILELLYHADQIFPKDDKDPIYDNPRMQCRIKHDLLLLENQLPFKVLKTLYTLTLGKILPDGCPSLTQSVHRYFGDVISRASHSDSFIINVDDEKPFHLLHVVHNRYLPPKKYRSDPPEENRRRRTAGGKLPEKYISRFTSSRGLACLPCSKKADATVSGGVEFEFMRSATDLDFAGVKFKARVAPEKEKEEEKVSFLKVKCHGTKGIFWWCRKKEKDDKEEVPLLKIKFHDTEGIFWWWRKARFEIPVMTVEDATERYLRNLIAFEHCCSEVGNHFSWYAAFMDQLISSEDDVKVLERDGVLTNCLGNRKVVAEMFNNLCNEVITWEDYFTDDCHRAVYHSKKVSRKFMAHLRRKWFDGPWTFIAFLVAAIVFVVSIIQLVLRLAWH